MVSKKRQEKSSTQPWTTADYDHFADGLEDYLAQAGDPHVEQALARLRTSPPTERRAMAERVHQFILNLGRAEKADALTRLSDTTPELLAIRLRLARDARDLLAEYLAIETKHRSDECAIDVAATADLHRRLVEAMAYVVDRPADVGCILEEIDRGTKWAATEVLARSLANRSPPDAAVLQALAGLFRVDPNALREAFENELVGVQEKYPDGPTKAAYKVVAKVSSVSSRTIERWRPANGFTFFRFALAATEPEINPLVDIR